MTDLRERASTDGAGRRLFLVLKEAVILANSIFGLELMHRLPVTVIGDPNHGKRLGVLGTFEMVGSEAVPLLPAD